MSNINYSGIVTIKKYRKNKLVDTQVLHNNGTLQLFNILLRFLAGKLTGISATSYESTIQYVVPKTLDLVDYASDSNESASVLKAKLPIESVVFNNNINPYTLQFKAFLSASDFKELNSEVAEGHSLRFTLNNTFNNLLDYKKDAETGELAYCDTPGRNYVISETEVHEIIWELRFSNKESSL